MYFSAKLSILVKRKAIKLFYFRNVVSRIDVFLNCQFREVDGDDGGTERSGSGATAERHLSEFSTQGGWRGLMVVAQSGVSRSDVFLNSQIRAGGWGRWWYQSGALRSDTFPNSRLRVAVGDDGGTERSFAERHLSEYST